MDDERLAVCEFCGQTFYSEAETAIERKKEALMKCKCDEAVRARKKLEYITNAKRGLREVFKYDFFSDDESTYGNTQEDIMEIISEILPYMVDFEVSGLTVSIPSSEKSRLRSPQTVKSKSSVKSAQQSKRKSANKEEQSWQKKSESFNVPRIKPQRSERLKTR